MPQTNKQRYPKTVCHSKMYWASLNKKPPLKEFKLPDLFSDNEDTELDVTTENRLKLTHTKNIQTDTTSTPAVNAENKITEASTSDGTNTHPTTTSMPVNTGKNMINRDRDTPQTNSTGPYNKR